MVYDKIAIFKKVHFSYSKLKVVSFEHFSNRVTSYAWPCFWYLVKRDLSSIRYCPQRTLAYTIASRLTRYQKNTAMYNEKFLIEICGSVLLKCPVFSSPDSFQVNSLFRAGNVSDLATIKLVNARLPEAICIICLKGFCHSSEVPYSCILRSAQKKPLSYFMTKIFVIQSIVYQTMVQFIHCLLAF